MRQYKRSARIGQQLLRDLSELFRDEYGAETPELVTFTHVKISDDLRYATVYYSCLGDEGKRGEVAVFLEDRRKRLRHLIGSTLQLRHTPELAFKFDPSVEEGIKIEKLLNEIKSDSEK